MQSWPRISKDDFRYKWKLDRLDVLNLGSEFEQRRAVNLEVFDESHRAVENFFTLCEVAVGYYTLADIHKIIVLPFEREFHIVPHHTVVV